MSAEVHFAWPTGATLTFAVFTEAGVQRETGTALTETPAASGNYIGSPTLIAEGDTVIVSDASGVIGGGQYWLDTLADDMDSLLTATNKHLFVYDQTAEDIQSTIVI